MPEPWDWIVLGEEKSEQDFVQAQRLLSSPLEGDVAYDNAHAVGRWLFHPTGV
jgi:hypothetical protein